MLGETSSKAGTKKTSPALGRFGDDGYGRTVYADIASPACIVLLKLARLNSWKPRSRSPTMCGH